MNMTPLLNAGPIIQGHVIAAMIGLVLGGIALFRRKGDRWHKMLGKVWVAAAAITALSSFLIWKIKLVGPFSPIHLLSVITLLSLFYGVKAAREGRIKAHQRAFKNLFWVAFVVTGLFTLLPGRIMHQVLVEPLYGSAFARIIVSTPVWVWPLLVLLVAVGILASRTRNKSLAQLLPMPFTFAGLGVAGVATSNNMPITVAAMVIAGVATYQLGVAIARRQHVRVIDPGRVEVPGEWMTMGIIIAVFASKFIFGAASGMQPAVAHMPIAIAIMGAISGAAFGLSLGRTVVYVRALRENLETNSASFDLSS